MKVIAVDFDDTYTADPDLFNAFIQLAKAKGHYVVCVTSRPPDFDNSDIERAMPGIEVIYTNGKQKREAAIEQGLPDVDIWVDDMPQYI